MLVMSNNSYHACHVFAGNCYPCCHWHPGLQDDFSIPNSLDKQLHAPIQSPNSAFRCPHTGCTGFSNMSLYSTSERACVYPPQETHVKSGKSKLYILHLHTVATVNNWMHPTLLHNSPIPRPTPHFIHGRWVCSHGCPPTAQSRCDRTP